VIFERQGRAFIRYVKKDSGLLKVLNNACRVKHKTVRFSNMATAQSPGLALTLSTPVLKVEMLRTERHKNTSSKIWHE